ncbi:hypothetical protein [Bartonella sp. F02]|uniref:hypothetical protein n=1 Tax=Bartonella sp. F02 TaxID=2967262 RepID=UPI0022A9CF6E|nr:hypothetical protein [Bartonella sp. F02]MCZ2328950.1 hypothetical protein [Bartonella sp. F02]
MNKSTGTNSSVKERAKSKLQRDMGPELLAALNDPKTEEISVNADGKIWWYCHGEKPYCMGTIRPALAQAIIETVAGLPVFDPANLAQNIISVSEAVKQTAQAARMTAELDEKARNDAMMKHLTTWTFKPSPRKDWSKYRFSEK